MKIFDLPRTEEEGVVFLQDKKIIYFNFWVVFLKVLPIIRKHPFIIIIIIKTNVLQLRFPAVGVQELGSGVSGEHVDDHHLPPLLHLNQQHAQLAEMPVNQIDALGANLNQK